MDKITFIQPVIGHKLVDAIREVIETYYGGTVFQFYPFGNGEDVVGMESDRGSDNIYLLPLDDDYLATGEGIEEYGEYDSIGILAAQWTASTRLPDINQVREFARRLQMQVGLTQLLTAAA